ncbi:MAG: tetratricopeptide repeat protein [Acidobacteria bacterium]|nr:tetratricopeptide repeat protein [Acidobacteriota bacterium]
MCPSAQSDSFEKIASQAAQAKEANQIEQAISLYRQALRLNPKWGEGWFYLATLHYDRDSFAEAAEAFRKATNLSPKIGTAWVMLGLSEFKLGRHDDSLKHIQKGRQLGITDNPQLMNVMLYHEGLLLLHKGDFDAAQKTLSKLSREGVENDGLINALGQAVLRVRPDQEQQAAIVRRAGQAEYFATQKKFEEALGEYERLVRDFPREQNLQYAYGRYLLTSNNEEKAIEAFKQEIANNSSHLLARLMIADTKLRLRDYAGGLPFAEEALKLRSDLPIAHFLVGSLLLEIGKTAQAINELETARRLLPDEPKIYFVLGRAYARANRKVDAERARATFERLNKLAEETANQ